MKFAIFLSKDRHFLACCIDPIKAGTYERYIIASTFHRDRQARNPCLPQIESFSDMDQVRTELNGRGYAHITVCDLGSVDLNLAVSVLNDCLHVFDRNRGTPLHELNRELLPNVVVDMLEFAANPTNFEPVVLKAADLPLPDIAVVTGATRPSRYDF